MNVKEYIDNHSVQEIRQKLIDLVNSTDSKSIEYLKDFLRYKENSTFYKSCIPILVAMALLQKGSSGVKALVEVFPEAPGAIYPSAIINAIWCASKGEICDSHILQILPPIPPLNNNLTIDTIRTAGETLKDLINESIQDQKIFDALMQYIYIENFQKKDENSKDSKIFRSSVLEILAEGKINISRRLIDEFQELIDKKENEEQYQKFLSKHPVFIDPLASEVIPKQKLGLEFITDFVVRRLDDKYILVEIEKPQDPIFNSSNDFSSTFTHAIGQALDFLQWVDSNGEYARKLLPNISTPKGFVIIGRTDNLTKRHKEKLHRFNVNSTKIEVLTYDDVLALAKRLHENIYK